MTSFLKSFITPLAYCVLASAAAGTARRVIVRGPCLAIVAAVLLSASAPNATAGVFLVANCDDDKLNYSTSAFTHAVTRRMMIRRACNPVGPGMRGLIAANVVRKGRVHRGAIARLTINAPPGTRITRFSWGGAARRRDCRYSLQMIADSPDTTERTTLLNVRANRFCATPRRTRSTLLYTKREWPIPHATRIVQRVACVGNRREKWCSARGLNYIRTEAATVQLVDYSPPAVAIVPNTPLSMGAWVSGAQTLNYTASDNVGVLRAAMQINGTERAWHDRPCVLASPGGPFAHPLPCPNGPGRIALDTTDVPTEGTHSLVVRAHDSARNGAASAAVTARIDNTPPPRVNVALEGGEAWRNQNDFAAVWTNAVELDRAPISAASYALCAAGTRSCLRGTQAGLKVSRLPVTVPRPGEWTLSIWRRDAAGNQETDNASVPVTLRYDPEPPQLAFEPVRASDPTLVAVRATDEVSGVASGAIEIGAAGSGVGRALATQRSSSGLVARINDATLPPGAYILRARASDQAGNETSTDRRADGQPMVIMLPLRSPVSLQGGFERRLERRGRRRPQVVLQQTARVGYREPAVISGRLITTSGHALAGAGLQVLGRTGVAPEQQVATLTTDAAGRFRLVTAGTNSRALRIVYGGSAVTLPGQLALEMRVPAATTARVNRRRLRNGQAVTFSGRVLGLPVPAVGKLVELQVRFTNGWQTFRTIRSDVAGRWSSRYRFRRTRGVQRYHFRIRLPKESGYPFETSVSRTLRVRVRGR